MQEITLKNGGVVPDVAAVAVMTALNDLLSKAPFAFMDIVELARDKNHAPFAIDILKSRGLIESDGRMHQITRDVILSAVSGDGYEMTLGSPYRNNKAGD